MIDDELEEAIRALRERRLTVNEFAGLYRDALNRAGSVGYGRSYFTRRARYWLKRMLREEETEAAESDAGR
jgi:hypothetical protein